MPDLLPAFVLAGFGVDFSAPAIQIGALSGQSAADQAAEAAGRGADFAVISALALLGMQAALPGSGARCAITGTTAIGTGCAISAGRMTERSSANA
jgi:hypothetical protein